MLLSEPPFITPQDQCLLDGLEVASVRAVDGYLPGQHRSRMRGGSAEFAEHRAYGIGDEVRRLDWRVLAKCDRYYIKQYDEESVLTAVLVMDANGGMSYAGEGSSKWDCARAVGAALARLLLAQRDPVGLALAADPLPPFLTPRSEASHYRVILDVLHRFTPQGPSALAGRLAEVCGRIRRRGLLFIISDFFCDLAPLGEALRRLSGRGHQLVLIHTVAPEELSFPFKDGVRFVSLEDAGTSISLDAPAFRDTYLTRLEAHLTALRRLTSDVRGDYVPMRTDQPVATVLADYLRKRAARLKTWS
ncbi:MAG TPA: DUF58 domain-containing protein [Verrucomicrobiales bacterium]|nr:DUF58 domain-containing protein [Verrucomicrobiales bacterium]